MAEKQKLIKSSTVKANEAKWKKTNVDAGWTLIPNALLVHQATLGLSPMDLNIILQIARYWWESGKHPYPSKSTLANSIGVTPRTIQKRIQEMEGAGFIRRIERRDSNGSKSNMYDLTPLVKQLVPYSQDMITERKKRKSEDDSRPNLRGKPKPALKVVGGSDD